MQRYISGLAAALLVLGAGACSSDDSDTPEKTSSDATTSADADQDGLIGKLVAADPPRDVVWIHKDPPADWKKLDTEEGTNQWQIADSRCLLTITQPNGLGTDETPTDDDLADEQVRRLTESAKLQNTSTPEKGTVMVPAKIKDLDGRVEQKFATRTFTADGGITSLIWARRYGDFAMLAYVACGSNEFDKTYDDSIRPFLEGLVIQATY